MKDLITRQNLMEKLESFLTRACEAEGANDHMEAERLFRMALYCEGNLVPKVTYVREYVNQARPVYKQEQLAEPASNSRKSIMKQKRKTDSHALQSALVAKEDVDKSEDGKKRQSESSSRKNCRGIVG